MGRAHYRKSDSKAIIQPNENYISTITSVAYTRFIQIADVGDNASFGTPTRLLFRNPSIEQSIGQETHTGDVGYSPCMSKWRYLNGSKIILNWKGQSV